MGICAGTVAFDRPTGEGPHMLRGGRPPPNHTQGNGHAEVVVVVAAAARAHAHVGGAWQFALVVGATNSNTGTGEKVRLPKWFLGVSH